MNHLLKLTISHYWSFVVCLPFLQAPKNKIQINTLYIHLLFDLIKIAKQKFCASTGVSEQFLLGDKKERF